MLTPLEMLKSVRKSEFPLLLGLSILQDEDDGTEIHAATVSKRMEEVDNVILYAESMNS